MLLLRRFCDLIVNIRSVEWLHVRGLRLSISLLSRLHYKPSHVTNSSCKYVLQYPLYTVMVFDKWRSGILVAYFFSSSTKEEHLQPILQALKDKVTKKLPSWEPSSIIVDNAQAEINVLQ